jgi:DNA adenine methylase
MSLKSVLRYPGGKSRAITQILKYIPLNFKEYREPMVGGGALFLYLKQTDFRIQKYWINDINIDLYTFWVQAQRNNQTLVKQIDMLLHQFSDGKELFSFLRDESMQFNDIELAARFFILNRITFSGTTDSGGYSSQAFHKRLTPSSIKRLEEVEAILNDTRISNHDYQVLIDSPGEDVFLFLDPPYHSATKSLLYGKNGNLHRSFDHERFANSMRNCNHKWLVTYDDSPYIRELFPFAHIYEWKLMYGMNNVGKSTTQAGCELFISNYDVEKQSYLLDNSNPQTKF